VLAIPGRSLELHPPACASPSRRRQDNCSHSFSSLPFTACRPCAVLSASCTEQTHPPNVPQLQNSETEEPRPAGGFNRTGRKTDGSCRTPKPERWGGSPKMCRLGLASLGSSPPGHLCKTKASMMILTARSLRSSVACQPGPPGALERNGSTPLNHKLAARLVHLPGSLQSATSSGARFTSETQHSTEITCNAWLCRPVPHASAGSRKEKMPPFPRTVLCHAVVCIQHRC